MPWKIGHFEVSEGGQSPQVTGSPCGKSSESQKLQADGSQGDLSLRSSPRKPRNALGAVPEARSLRMNDFHPMEELVKSLDRASDDHQLEPQSH